MLRTRAPQGASRVVQLSPFLVWGFLFVQYTSKMPVRALHSLLAVAFVWGPFAGQGYVHNRVCQDSRRPEVPWGHQCVMPALRNLKAEVLAYDCCACQACEQWWCGTTRPLVAQKKLTEMLLCAGSGVDTHRLSSLHSWYVCRRLKPSR